MKDPMVIIGLIVLAAGIIYTLVAFNIDTSVMGASYTQRIINSGLVADREAHLSIAETLTLVGVILVGFGRLSSRRA